MKTIPLTQGKFTIVDDDVYDYLMQWKWTFSGGYAYRLKTIKGKSKKIWLHREINATPTGKYTDHIDGNRLNNTRSNLRVCTYAENNKNAKTRKDNKSGYRGVHWEKGCRKWRAVINNNGKRITIGMFDDVVAAAIAYNEYAKKLHKEFARLNVVKEAL